jgi:hypothetical protein
MSCPLTLFTMTVIGDWVAESMVDRDAWCAQFPRSWCCAWRII